jgi:hypothetical protein
MNPSIPLTEEEKQKAKERIKTIIEAWDALCSSHAYSVEFKNISFLSIPIVTEISSRYIRDVKRIKLFHPQEIENINEYKIAGYLSYWISKLRPVQIKDSVRRFTLTQNVLNEELAFHISIGRINQERVKNGKSKIDFEKNSNMTKTFINEIFYTMKYRLTSGDNLAQIYRYTEIF